MRLLYRHSCALSLLLIFLISPSLSAETNSLRIATTTSLENSGLLDTLIPIFEKKHTVKVKVIACGTGAALRLAAAGDADFVLVHAPAAEEEFMAKGLGVERTQVMYNYFLIVGPPADPAGILGLSSAKEIFSRLAEKQAIFISRGDDSGTHKKGLAFWKEAGITPQGDWYRATGQGMAATLRVASEVEGYTLSDVATYLALKEKLNLSVLSKNNRAFSNSYSAIIVNPQLHPHTNYADARRFIEFLLLPETQKVIAQFGREKFGQPLFYTLTDTSGVGK